MDLLVVGGRDTAILNLGGEKINPERIEQVLASCPGVVEAGVCGVINALGVEEVHAAIVAKWRVRRCCGAQSLRAQPSARVPAGAVLSGRGAPRTGMGKLDRQPITGRYESITSTG